MQATKVIVKEVESERSLQVFPLAAEGVRQSRQSSHIGSHRQVIALHNRSRNAVRVRPSPARISNCFLQHRGRVFLNAIMRPRVQLNKLCELNASAKRVS